MSLGIAETAPEDECRHCSAGDRYCWRYGCMSMMIPFVVQDGEAAIELFKEEWADHLVGEGHLRKSYDSVGAGAQRIGEAVGAADGKGEFRRAVVTVCSDQPGKGRRGELFAQFVQQDQATVFRQELFDPLRFALLHQLRQHTLLFLYFGDFKRRVTLYPTGILLNPCFDPGFLSLADPEQAELHAPFPSHRNSDGISVNRAAPQSSSRL